jgi:hypothetical protein
MTTALKTCRKMRLLCGVAGVGPRWALPGGAGAACAPGDSRRVEKWIARPLGEGGAPTGLPGGAGAACAPGDSVPVNGP